MMSANKAEVGEFYYLYTEKGYKFIIKYLERAKDNFRDHKYKYWFRPFRGEKGEISFKDDKYWNNCKIEPLDDMTKIKILLVSQGSGDKNEI